MEDNGKIKEDITLVMDLAVGAIVEGKVTGITKFGAFVSLAGGKTGMVHISEIAHAYVSDISEYLSVGQEVKVKVIAIDPAGKINLSIKKTTEAPQRPQRQARQDRPDSRGERNDRRNGDQNNQRRSYDNRRPSSPRATTPKEPQSFDDMLKQFMADSDSKISSIKQYSDHRTKSKRRQ
jgi:S1 RNA binding domain protein